MRNPLEKIQAQRVAIVRKLALAGLRVFPLKPNSKIPAIKGWQEAATSDPDKAGAWWVYNPNYNIGIHAIDHLVVDQDLKDGGPEAWNEIVRQREMFGDEPAPTLTVWSGSGGIHEYYSLPPGKQVGNSTSTKFGRGIDIKSEGGLVVGPGSVIDGRTYDIIPTKKGKRGDIQKIMYPPEWMIQRAEAPRDRSKLAGVRVTPETPEAVAEAKRWLSEDAPEAVEGQGGDLATFKIAAKMFDLGLEFDTAMELVWDWNIEKAHPQWEYEALETKLQSGMINRQRAIGVDNPGAPPAGMEDCDFGPGEEASIGEAPPKVQARAKLKKKLGPKEGWQTVSFFEAAARAFTHGNEPLVDGLLDQGAMSVIYGESNSGKSFVKMDMDYHIAMGLPWQGMETVRGPTLWLAAEGGNGIYKRFQGLMQHYKPEEEPWFDTLQRPLDLLDPDGDLNGVLDLIKRTEDRTGRAVGNITIDTLSRVLAGGNENGPEDMGQMVRHFDMIRHYSEQAHLCVIHHSGKMAAAGARGHSLLRAATDTEIEVTKEGLFSVKKQRDLDSEWEFKFELRQLQLGKDRRRKEITSAVVIARVRSSGHAILKPAEQEVYDAIVAKMVKEKMPPGTSFDGAFILDACSEKRLRRGIKGHWSGQRDNESWQRSVRRSRVKLEEADILGQNKDDRYIINL